MWREIGFGLVTFCCGLNTISSLFSETNITLPYYVDSEDGRFRSNLSFCEKIAISYPFPQSASPRAVTNTFRHNP